MTAAELAISVEEVIRSVSEAVDAAFKPIIQTLTSLQGASPK